jgi:hypothetical protein
LRKIARLVARVVFPTPPFSEETVITYGKLFMAAMIVEIATTVNRFDTPPGVW